MALTFRFVLHQPTSDFDQIVIGAQRALAGSSPYTSTPLHGLQWPIYYPMPAILLGLPFVALPLPVAHAIFSGISGALFGWALSRDGDAKLFSLGSWPYILTVSLGQWGLLLMALSGLPGLAWLAIAKPNIGLALAAGYAPRWLRGRNVWINIGCAVSLLVGSWVLRPSWLVEWLRVMRQPAPHMLVPLTVLGGPVLLLCLLRWRRPEARLLTGLACVPQTFSSYDSLIVFLAAETRREALLLVACTTAATLFIAVIGPAPAYAETVHRFAPMRIALVYAPAVFMVLRRPNAADVRSTGADSNRGRRQCS